MELKVKCSSCNDVKTLTENEKQEANQNEVEAVLKETSDIELLRYMALVMFKVIKKMNGGRR